MRRLLLSSGAIVALFVLFQAHAYAGTTWAQDDFNSNTPTTTVNGKVQDNTVDYTATNALVTIAPDTTNGNVTISNNILPNEFQLIDPTDYVIGTQSGIEWVSYNQTTGAMQGVTSYSVPSVTPLAFAVDPSTHDIFTYDKSAGTIREFVFNGSAMQENTVAQVTTGAPVYSMSYDSKDKILFTQGKNNQGQQVITGYTINGSGGLSTLPWLNQMVINDSGGIGVSSTQNTPDFIASTQAGSYYYAFNSSTSTYQPVPTMNVTYGQNAIAFASNDQTSQIFMTSTQVSGYALNSNTGAYQTTNIYAISPLPSKPYDISMLQGSQQYDYGILTKDGYVHYYAYNQTTGKMQEVNYLDSSGYQVVQGMNAKAVFQTTQLVAPSSQTYQQFQLSAMEYLPSNTSGNTSISWAYSLDGTTWTPLTMNPTTTTSTISSYQPGTTTVQSYTATQYESPWIYMSTPTGTVYLQATLNATPDQSKTPMIFGYTLYGTNVSFVPGTFKVIQVTTSNPNFTDSMMNTFPLPLYEGDQVVYQIETTGNATLSAQYIYDNGTTVNVPPLSPPDENITSTTPNNVAGSSDIQLWTVTVTLPQTTTAQNMYVILTATNGTQSVTFTQNPFVTINNTYGTNVYTYLAQ